MAMPDPISISDTKTVPSPSPLSHLNLDFDSFFASAEQHFNPDLRRKPVGVVPLDVPNTGCIAISREAKRAGVPSGASIKEARAILPDMIFVVARPDAYVRLHRKILTAIETVLPIEKVHSIDELVCLLSSADAATPYEVGRRIKAVLAQTFSKGLTCSIGIAHSLLQAKIAAEMNKPDGLVVLEPKTLPQAIAHIPLSDIPGIAKGIAARLHKAGIDDMRALWAVGRKQARALWGSIAGERFWCGLHGHAFEQPETTKRMFGHSRMLPADWETPEKVHECARQLLFGAAASSAPNTLCCRHDHSVDARRGLTRRTW